MTLYKQQKNKSEVEDLSYITIYVGKLSVLSWAS